MISNTSKLGQGIIQSPENNALLGLLEGHPDRDTLMQVLDIDINDLREQSSIFPEIKL